MNDIAQKAPPRAGLHLFLALLAGLMFAAALLALLLRPQKPMPFGPQPVEPRPKLMDQPYHWLPNAAGSASTAAR